MPAAARSTDPTARATPRWEKKRLRAQQDRARAGLLRERAKASRAERGASVITRAAPCKKSSRAYVRSVTALHDAVVKTKLLPSRGQGGVDPSDGYLRALASLADWHAKWRRPPGEWAPRSHNRAKQFASLALHLMGDYAPPACWGNAWFNADAALGRREQGWYVHAARGMPLRAAPRLPAALTRRAAHALGRAPAELSATQGVRWAQVVSLGVPAAHAGELVASPMGVDFARDAFWLELARWFAAHHGAVPVSQARPVVDWVHHVRHAPRPPVLVDGALVQQGAERPGLSMRGRSPESVLEQVERWHARLRDARSCRRRVAWRSCGLGSWDRLEGAGEDAVLWSVQELTDSDALLAEGRTMRHCVASYVGLCESGQAAVCTLSRLKGAELRRVLTVEVRVGERMVVQARGRFNAEATPDAMRVLRLWAGQAGLRLSDWL